MVPLLLLWVTFFGFLTSSIPQLAVRQAHAQSDTAVDLPKIEARVHTVQTLRRSKSARVYLFQNQGSELPSPGKLLLIRKSFDSDPIVALRVLKNYSDKNQFAVRRVKRYVLNKPLEIRSDLLAIEKLSDLGPVTSAEIKEYQPDLDDIEKQTGDSAVEEELPNPEAFDPELDSGLTPFTGDEDPEDKAAAADAELQSLTFQEVKSLDPDRFWIGAEVGFLRNGDGLGNYEFYRGTGAKLGFSFTQNLFFYSNSVQDSLVLEATGFYYSVLNLAGVVGDNYNLIPAHGALRYNILVGPNLVVYGYGGFGKNFVFPATGATTEGLNALNSSIVALGGGFFFRIGPKWYLRCSLGTDFLGGGLTLRF